MREISVQTGILLGSVHNISSTPTTHKKCPSRPRILDTPTRKRLIDFVKESAVNRWIAFVDVALHCSRFIYLF